jgi:hypothetical protein
MLEHDMAADARPCDPYADDLETLYHLTSTLPGGRVNPSTIYRWKTKGRRGHRLPFITITGIDYSQRSLFVEWLQLTSLPTAASEGRSTGMAAKLSDAGLV